MRFRLEQRQIDKVAGISCKPIMEKLSKFFDVNLLEVNRKSKLLNNVNLYYFEVSKKDKLTKVIDYFDLYPAFSLTIFKRG